MIKLDNLEEACIGSIQLEENHLVYSIDSIVQLLEYQGMTHDDALEYFEFNISRTVDYLKSTQPKEYPILLNDRQTYQSIEDFVELMNFDEEDS